MNIYSFSLDIDQYQPSGTHGGMRFGDMIAPRIKYIPSMSLFPPIPLCTTYELGDYSKYTKYTLLLKLGLKSPEELEHTIK